MGGSVRKIVTVAVVGAAIATGVGAIAAGGLGALAPMGGTFLGLSGAIGFAVQSFAIQAVLGAVGSALQPKPEQFTSAAELRGRTVMTKQSITPRDVVYGEIKKSGSIVFLETTNDEQDLHVCVTLAGHEINAVKDVFFNEIKVRDADLSDSSEVNADSGTTPDFSSTAKITAHFGNDDQLADANLVSRTSFTNSHRLRGIAYLYTRLQFDQDVYPNGLPNVSAIVQGKKVYDPRTATTAYSNNAALCIRDYISNSTYGLGSPNSEIDDDSFIAAANICDENVTVLGGGTEKRYTINGVVDTSKQPAEILNDLLTSCGGSIYYSNGKWHIKVGAFITPSVTLTNDDLRGSIRLQTRNAGRDQFNAVKGIFVSPENNHQPTDFPEVKSTTFETEDGGDRKYLDLVLPYTTSVSSAQRLAKQILYRNREQIVITMPCKLTAFQFEVGDTFRYTNERLGFNQKIFEVISWTFAFEGEELGVELVAKETSTAIYQWDSAVDEQAFTFNNTTLPDAFDLAPVTLIASDELRVLNQEAISVLVVNVSSAETFATRFEVEAKKTSDTDFVNMGQASGNRFELLNVEDGITYDIRARIISTLGIRSQFETATHQVVGKTAPPQDVTDFAVNIIGTEAHLSWTPVTDADLSHYVIRHSPLTTGAEYANSRTIADKLSRPANTAVVPALTGTYFIKAVDKLDLASTNPTASVAIIEEIKGFNLVETSTQHPAFTGSKTEVVAVDNELILDTSVDFDDVTGNFDDANGSFDGGGGTVSTSGTYEFDNYIDLTAVYTSHVTASVSVTRRDYVNLFDDAVGLFDARTGTFDGDVQAFDDTDVEVQVSTTDDDPAGSPTWSNYRRFIVGDYKARALRFRAILTSGDGEATPVVSQLSVTVDMPDRSVAEADIASGAGAKVITFSPAFKALQGVGIAAQNLQSGDYYNVTSKTATGFTITFYNSSNTAVDRTFDYVAKGYGEVAA